MPAGRLSVTATPDCVRVADGFVMVRVRVEVPPEAMVAGAKALAIEGGVVTVNVAVLDAVPVPPFVEVTALVVLL